MAAEMPPTPVGRNAYRDAEHSERIGKIRQAVTQRPPNTIIKVVRSLEQSGVSSNTVATEKAGLHQVNISSLRHFLRCVYRPHFDDKAARFLGAALIGGIE